MAIRTPPWTTSLVHMSELKQYVIAARLTLSGSDATSARSRAQHLMHNYQRVGTASQYDEHDSAVVELAADEARALQKSAGDDVIVTPLVRYSVGRVPTFPTHVRDRTGSGHAPGPTRSITIRLVDTFSRPIEGARVVAYFSKRWNWGAEGLTDASGLASLMVSASVPAFDVVYIYPLHSFWPAYYVGVSAEDHEFTLESLPMVRGLEWWAELLGVRAAHAAGHRGQGVKIAVVDTGVTRHPDLPRIADGYNLTQDGGTADFDDVDGHGTHVAGIIAASADLTGIAPDAEIYALRVFAEGEEAYNSDIREAIAKAVDEWGCDIINLSLGGPYDEAIEDAIDYATSRGALCVAAAGNSGGAVEYPGALRHSFCIGAVGMPGTYPAGSIHRQAEPASQGLYGGWGIHTLYAADFTCRGAEVDGCAPGVAIISTVPPSFYAALEGTSMACPMAAGAAAILLDRNTALRHASRDGARSARLRVELQAALRDVRLPRPFQGGGVPNL